MTVDLPLVLVVDDDATQRVLLEAQVTRLGWPVLAVAGGAEAVATIDETFVGLVLLDRWMPDLDGVEVARRIRAAEAAGSSRVPIVGLTASADTAGVDECLAAGMDEVRTKPLLLEDLTALLDRWAAPGGPAGGARSGPAPATAGAGTRPADDLPLVDPERRATTVAELGGEVVATIVTTFLDALPPRRAAVVDAARDRRLDDLQRAAHLLAGAADLVAAARLAARCRVLAHADAVPEVADVIRFGALCDDTEVALRAMAVDPRTPWDR